MKVPIDICSRFQNNRGLDRQTDRHTKRSHKYAEANKLWTRNGWMDWVGE